MRSSYANITSTLALVIALSMGGAYAHGKIGSSHIKHNAVKSRHIGFQHVKTPDIKRGAVTTGKVRGRSIHGGKLRRRIPGVVVAGVHARADGTLEKSFNRVGGTPRVDNPQVGTYVVTVPGATLSSSSILQVSSPPTNTPCRAFDDSNFDIDQIGVVCSGGSVIKSTPFSLTVVKE